MSSTWSPASVCLMCGLCCVQHNTTQHNTTQHNTTQHNTTQHNTTQHNTTQHNTTPHHTTPHHTHTTHTQHNTTQHNNNTTQHNTTQHNTTQHNTTQHHTTQHNTTQHNTTQHTLTTHTVTVSLYWGHNSHRGCHSHSKHQLWGSKCGDEWVNSFWLTEFGVWVLRSLKCWTQSVDVYVITPGMLDIVVTRLPLTGHWLWPSVAVCS